MIVLLALDGIISETGVDWIVWLLEAYLHLLKKGFASEEKKQVVQA